MAHAIGHLPLASLSVCACVCVTIVVCLLVHDHDGSWPWESCLAHDSAAAERHGSTAQRGVRVGEVSRRDQDVRGQELARQLAQLEGLSRRDTHLTRTETDRQTDTRTRVRRGAPILSPSPPRPCACRLTIAFSFAMCCSRSSRLSSCWKNGFCASSSCSASMAGDATSRRSCLESQLLRSGDRRLRDDQRFRF